MTCGLEDWLTERISDIPSISGAVQCYLLREVPEVVANCLLIVLVKSHCQWRWPRVRAIVNIPCSRAFVRFWGPFDSHVVEGLDGGNVVDFCIWVRCLKS